MPQIVVNAAVIHTINKNMHTHGEGSATVQIRNSLHPSNNLLDQFVQRVDEDAHTVTRIRSRCDRFNGIDTLAKCVADHYVMHHQQTLAVDKFLELSEKLVRALAKRMESQTTATGGHIPVLWYVKEGVEMLFIGLVNPSSGFTIDDSTGAIVSNTNIDKNALRFSSIVILSDFNDHLNACTQDPDVDINCNYVLWTKRHKDIAHYFQQYIPTAIALNDGKVTKKTCKYFHKYLEYIFPETTDSAIKRKLIDSVEQDIYQMMSDKCDLESPVSIDDDILPILNDFISTHEEHFDDINALPSFIDFCDEQKFEYVSVFHPKKDIIDKELRVKIEVKGIEIKGSKQAMASATQLVVVNGEDGSINNETYGFMVKLNKEQYEFVHANNPNMSVLTVANSYHERTHNLSQETD